MDKDSIKELLNLPYKHVLYPSNLLTIDNPDMLILAEGGLYGLFFPLKKELENPDYLLRRVMAARLSYTGNMKALLVIEDEITNVADSILSQAFHHITYDDSIENLKKLLKDKQFVTRTRKISKKIKKSTLDKFSKCMEISEKAFSVSNQYAHFELEKSHQNLVYSWACPNKKKIINDVYYDEDLLFAFKGKTKSTFKKSFENLITYSFMMNYQLQDGKLLINSNTYNLAKIVNTDYEIVNNDKTDSYKYARQLAYMGLSAVKINSKDDMEEIKKYIYGQNK